MVQTGNKGWRKHVLKHIRDDANDSIPFNDGPPIRFPVPYLTPPFNSYPLNTCHYLPILLVLIHASVLITMFYPIVYPFCSFFSIFFGIVVPMFLGLLNVPPIRFIFFVASNGGYSAQQQGKTCSRRSCERPPSAWRRASVETPQVRRAGRK